VEIQFRHHQRRPLGVSSKTKPCRRVGLLPKTFITRLSAAAENGESQSTAVSLRDCFPASPSAQTSR
jgi:hypothetical protein